MCVRARACVQLVWRLSGIWAEAGAAEAQRSLSKPRFPSDLARFRQIWWGTEAPLQAEPIAGSVATPGESWMRLDMNSLNIALGCVFWLRRDGVAFEVLINPETSGRCWPLARHLGIWRSQGGGGKVVRGCMGCVFRPVGKCRPDFLTDGP